MTAVVDDDGLTVVGVGVGESDASRRDAAYGRAGRGAHFETGPVGARAACGADFAAARDGERQPALELRKAARARAGLGGADGAVHGRMAAAFERLCEGTL